MANIKVIRGDTLNIAVVNILIEMDDGSFYPITSEDKFTFSICMPRNKPILQRRFPDGMQLVNGRDLLMTFSPEETETLKCLSYDYDCKFDYKGKGEDIHTIARGEVQVYESATKLAGGSA
jgi:hypothetical protein